MFCGEIRKLSIVRWVNANFRTNLVAVEKLALSYSTPGFVSAVMGFDI